jgi:hypothetical protein
MNSEDVEIVQILSVIQESESESALFASLEIVDEIKNHTKPGDNRCSS